MSVELVVEDRAAARRSELSIACGGQGNLVLVALKGELDMYTVARFWERVERFDPAEVQLVIDLSGVGLLDSAGLSALVILRNEADRRGARLGLICPHRRLLGVFGLTGLRGVFAVGDDLAAVCAELAADPSARRQTPVPAGAEIVDIAGARRPPGLDQGERGQAWRRN
jgi:anti-sigma B factor antagonist